jgi:hypothetical protein
MPQTPKSKIPPPPESGSGDAAVSAEAFARDAFGREIPEPQHQQPSPFDQASSPPSKRRKEAATDALGRRAGALADELDFPAFVASLVHGTFDAIVDSSIRQMESYADLVAAVAKPLDQFAEENVTRNQARDWLATQFPSDVGLADSGDELTLIPITQQEDDFVEPPVWLEDFGFEGEPLTAEFLEESLLPVARERVAQQRLSTLATMVLLGMNRVVVRDGSIGARLRFRAAAADHAAIQYATDNDPGTGVTEWGRRGSDRPAVTKVSTVGVNVQSDSELKAELFGDVKINFASETVPLDRFIDEAQRSLLERHSRRLQPTQPLPAAALQPEAALPAPVPAANPVPVTTPQTPSVPSPPSSGEAPAATAPGDAT